VNLPLLSSCYSAAAPRHVTMRNRHELPRAPWSAGTGVAGPHPVLAHGLDDRRNIGVGVAQKFLGLAALPGRSERGTPLIIETV
jgi:hypothetical protein